ncbi:MAG: phosphoribosyl-AMP cyclohydrolase [Gammaproteobacteria bacterium]
MIWLEQVAWNNEGLVPVAVTNVVSGRLLMLAWMNREALAATANEGRTVFWSRSRQRLWRKGETSGHVQHVVEIRLDCDNDAIQLMVRQAGEIACHTGRQSCFFQRLDDDGWRTVEPMLKDPAKIYGDKADK